MKKNTKSYTEKDIEVLSDRNHVRLRLPVYAGSTTLSEYSVPLFINNSFEISQMSFVPAVYKCVGEIIDNSVDEFAQSGQRDKHLIIEAQPLLGTYAIKDNGRGVPIGKHKTGKYTPEIVFGSLRSGRNFSGDKTSGVIGMNGMGSSITCFCSTAFYVDIHRDKKRYRQTFIDGALKIRPPSIRKASSGKSGTAISFQLDNQVFEDVTLPETLIHNRAIELALTNPGITVEYNKKKYKFRKGFEDVVKKISNNTFFKFEKPGIEFYVVFNVNQELDEVVFSWVNSSLLFDGGLCNIQFLNAFYDRVIKHLKNAAKKNKCEITKNDIRQCLLVFGNLKLTNPEYDAQSKTRLTGPNLRKDIGIMLDEMWPTFVRKNKNWLNEVLERAILRYHSQANKKAIKNHTKNLKKKVPGLVDATSKNRFECQLLITEGDSAASMITDARNPRTTASLPLRGKINNVYGNTIAQLLKMEKVKSLLTSIGLIPGVKTIRSNLQYGKIVIATDSDVDGGDIFTLLINLFYQFWPELFDPNYDPIVYRLIAPNVCLIKGKKRIHFPSIREYQKNKNKYKGYEVRYYKGLGSMNRVDWEMILSGKTNTMVPIVDDGKMSSVLELLFSNNSDKRKKWLQEND